MSGLDSYSVTPATNATATGGAVNASEGQAPSTVNNTMRQQMADQRAAFNDLAWFNYGSGDQGSGNVAVPSVYASATSFTITGADVHLIYEANRRVRAVGNSTGTIFGTISSSSYNSGNSTTTVNVTWDSGSLSNETLVVSLAQIPVTGKPVNSASIAFGDGATWSSSGIRSLNSFVVGASAGVAQFLNTIVSNGNSLSHLALRDTSPANGDALVAFMDNTPTTRGSIAWNGTTAVQYNTTSDENLKTATGVIANSGAFIDAVPARTFTWKEDGSPGVGLFAQEVYAQAQHGGLVTPGSGVPGEVGYKPWQMDYSGLIPYLWAEVQSLRARLKAAGIP